MNKSVLQKKRKKNKSDTLTGIEDQRERKKEGKDYCFALLAFTNS